MNKWIQKIETPQLEKLKSEEKSSVNIGDTVKIGYKFVKVIELCFKITKEQLFDDIMDKKYNYCSSYFQGVGIERIFPLYSPAIVKIEVLAQGKVRRAKLNYLRNKKGKAARLKARS